MDCWQLCAQIESLTLSAPDAPLVEAMLHHLQACASCRMEFRDYQDVWLMLTAALPTSPVGEALEERAMQRVNVPELVREYSSRARYWKYVVATSVLFLLFQSRSCPYCFVVAGWS